MIDPNAPEQITKEVINTSAGHCASGGRCKYCGLWAEERCAKHFASALLAKCAEAEELRKALVHISELTSESAGGPWTKDIHICARKALEGKE